MGRDSGPDNGRMALVHKNAALSTRPIRLLTSLCCPARRSATWQI